PVSLSALTWTLSMIANWERFDRRRKKFERSDPPTRPVSILFDAQRYNHLLPLAGIARQPYLRPDGTLSTLPGYDEATGVFGVFDARQFSIPENPTKQDALTSLARL